MFLVTVNKSKQLLYLHYVHHVSLEELQQGRADLEALLVEVEPGFRLITDVGRLDSIDPNCTAEIGRFMELCDQKGIGVVVRVIPDPAKDIGFSILSLFHYRHEHRTVTCESLAEAAEILSL